jgi:glycosyltransferase involved in cell wall biosynthesis
MTMLYIINNYKFKSCDIVFLSDNDNDTKIQLEPFYKVNWKPLIKNKNSIYLRIINLIKKVFLSKNSLRQDWINRNNKHGDLLKKEISGVADIILYLTPMPEIYDFPYIMNVWDIGHHTTYSFPELQSNGEFEYRVEHYDKIYKKAFVIFVESESGKKDLNKYLSINEKKIKVIPLIPSSLVINSVVGIKPNQIEDGAEFIHYPAQFWPHKNHYNLLLAFSEVLREKPLLKLIFTGSEKGNKEYINSVIENLRIKESVIDLGFVSVDELKWLYVNSKGLVMPTFLGPTNMPLLEAKLLGCPVACSNLEGHFEQLAEYAYYFDPIKPSEIADAILSMLNKSIPIKTHEETNYYKDTLDRLDHSFQEIANVRHTFQ